MGVSGLSVLLTVPAGVIGGALYFMQGDWQTGIFAVCCAYWCARAWGLSQR